MRFFWLALSIVFPLVLPIVVPLLLSVVFPVTADNAIEQSNNKEIALYISYVVGCLAEIVFIALCVSEFVGYHKKQEYVTHQKIRHDRDEDVKKWRKEFMRDSLDLFEMQNESLKRAEDLAGRSERRGASAHDFANANANVNTASADANENSQNDGKTNQ